jgi:hypothetical protein
MPKASLRDYKMIIQLPAFRQRTGGQTGGTRTPNGRSHAPMPLAFVPRPKQTEHGFGTPSRQ